MTRGSSDWALSAGLGYTYERSLLGDGLSVDLRLVALVGIDVSVVFPFVNFWRSSGP